MKNYNSEFIGKVLSVEENPDGAEVYLNVRRTGEKDDTVPLIFSSEALEGKEITIDSTIRVHGVLVTKRSKGSFKSRLRVEVVSWEVVPDDTKHKNTVFGRFILKSSKDNRVTRTGLKIKDIILTRELPDIGVSEFRAILWNDYAEQYSDVNNGVELYIIGRLQSREYLKTEGSQTVRVRTYEVSVGKIQDDTDSYAEEIISES